MLCGIVPHMLFMYVTCVVENQLASGSSFFMGFESILDLKIMCYRERGEEWGGGRGQ